MLRFCSKLTLCIFLRRLKPESLITFLNTDFGSRGFWTIRIIYVLRTSFPDSCHSSGLGSSWQLPVSPPSSEPRHKRKLSTLQRKYLNIELTPGLTKLTQEHQ
ncbi:hypothetical protein ILYODFUR_038984 [Ilyodon furcidens]|uniref:Uncharacterized protein n=1 Tax=Ilyodon furcidens TaxID=33524 RepID=A0ABV0T417_9TELE